MDELAREQELDLESCDREPIHVPGAIQPHGVLFAMREPGLAIEHVSASVEAHLGRRPAERLGRPLEAARAPASAALVRAVLAEPRPGDRNPLALEAGGRAFDGIVHRQGGLAILELEPRHPGSDVRPTLRLALGALEAPESAEALGRAVVASVRRLTGFERVMSYRFDEAGHGSVEAEDREPSLEPYLGLHYPASDIPRQARELYLRSWLRIIPDRRYAPSPLLSTTGVPLDLSYAVLRSVSPVHLQYMANMGVRASMSISLVVRGRLWGLVSCANHTAPRFVSYETRAACEAIGRIVSLQLAALEDRARATARAGRAGLQATLAAAMEEGGPDDDVLAGLLRRPEELLALVGASGAAVLGHGTPAVVGPAPDASVLAALSAWLDRRDAGVVASSRLAEDVPAAAPAKGVASGLLAIDLPGMPRRRVLWFRPEQVRTVAWGGDPRKPAEPGPAGRLCPRRSFEEWKHEVRLRAHPWSDADLDAAEELHRRALELDVERQLVRAERAVKARDDLVAVVSHDLKNPLAVVQMQAAVLLRQPAEDTEAGRKVRTAAERIRRAVASMQALVTDLLDLAKLEAGRFELELAPASLPDLLEEALVVLRPLAADERLDLVGPEADPCTVRVDRERLFQVVSNVVGNAIKFTPPGGRIAIEARCREGEVQVSVSDTGPGIPAESRPFVFDRYRQAPGASRRKGAGLGLYIARGIVEAHGGRIWAG